MSAEWSHLGANDFDNLDILRKVAPEAVQGILGSCEMRSVEPGETLIAAGSVTGELYLILEGQLSVHVVGNSSKTSVIEPITLTVGQTVGELSVIDQSPTSAEVEAVYFTRVLVITEEKFWRLIDVSHEFAKNMLILLSQRMRSDNTLLEESIIMKNMFEEQSTLDPLTSLHNRRWIDMNLHKLIRRADFSNEPISVLMLDVDHFKKVNDDYGHLKGDMILRFVAHTIRDSIRPHDFACRYGGEEFLIIFPRTSIENALIPAERIRRSIEKKSILVSEENQTPAVTITGGLSSLQNFAHENLTDEEISEEIIGRADKNLYLGKELGRNRILR